MHSTTAIHFHGDPQVFIRTNGLVHDLVRISIGADHIGGTSLVMSRSTLARLRREIAIFTAAERDPGAV